MAEYVCGCHQAPVPPDGYSPVPVWVVTTGGDGDRYEVAAAFADGSDARRYAAWWNREETRRYGHLPTHAMATAVTEEIDFYPTGAWRPPTRLHVAETSVTSTDNSSPTHRVPTLGGPTDHQRETRPAL